MAVVKADAYGHGAVQVAKLLQSQCSFFGVSSILEAMELRQAGISVPILVLGHMPPEAFLQAVEHEIRPAIFMYEDAAALSTAAVMLGKTAYFHFAVDTGMSRIGFQVTEGSADICRKILELPGISAEGMFSHFATADSADLGRTERQAELFSRFDSMLQARGIHIPIRHLDNSAGIMNYPHPYEMVRSGIITYGLYPSTEVDKDLLNIRPALRWTSHIAFIKELPAGREIGYGAAYTTKRTTRVATIPVGYADGYRRSLSGKFYVLIHSRKAPILGRICMDQMMVDVSDIPDAAMYDEVVLIGRSGNLCISVEEIAAASDSFNYELICSISRRVPRIYYSSGKEITSVRYLLNN